MFIFRNKIKLNLGSTFDDFAKSGYITISVPINLELHMSYVETIPNVCVYVYVKDVKRDLD